MIDINEDRERGYFIITIDGELSGEQLTEELVAFYARPELDPNANYLWDLRSLHIQGAFSETAKRLSQIIGPIKEENPSEIHVAFLTGDASTAALANWYSRVTARPNLIQRHFDDASLAAGWLESCAS